MATDVGSEKVASEGKLRVGLFDDEGKLDRVVTLADPRDRMIEFYNGLVPDGRRAAKLP